MKKVKVIHSQVIGNKHEYGEKECDVFPIGVMLDMMDEMWIHHKDIHKLREDYKKGHKDE